jgi:AcrR family transcriptional regulator
MRGMSTQPRRAGTGTRTPSRDVRSALVDAAEAVLVRDGPEAVTVRNVAAEAGVAPMGVYNRFGNKEGLVEALLVRAFEGLREAVSDRGELDPMHRLRGAGERYRLFALGHPQQYNIMFGHALPSGEPTPELLNCAGGAFAALVGHVSTAMAAGKLRAGDPSDVAQLIWSAVHGAVSLEMNGQILATDAEANYQALLDLVMRGLTT